MSKTEAGAEFIPLRIAVITISDSRTEDNDTSGDYLAESLQAEGHHLALRKIVSDERYVLRAEVSALVADPEVDVILTTGSTGLTGRDVAPEAQKIDRIDEENAVLLGRDGGENSVRGLVRTNWLEGAGQLCSV